MRILVTGATGFIGSHLAARLEQEGHEVTRLLRYVAGGRYSFYDQKNVIFADLRDADSVRSAVHIVQPEAVFHLGAQSAVSYSFQAPLEVAATNFMGTIAMAMAALEVKVLNFFHASTSEVYGRAKEFPISEDGQIGATSPYAASKIGAEEFLRVLHQTRGFPVTIVRPFNSYGRGITVKNRHFVVERAITQAIEDGVIRLHDPTPRRDFLFRDDHVDAYLTLLKNRDRVVGETYNVATGYRWTIKEMADAVAAAVANIMAKPVHVEFSEIPDRPLDIPILQGNSSKLQALGWAPKYTFYAGIRKAVEEWISVLQT